MPNTNILIRLHLFVSVSSLGYYFHFHFHVHPFILFVCRDDTIIHQKRARSMSIHQQWRIDNHQCGAGGYYLKRDRPEMKRVRKRVRERARVITVGRRLMKRRTLILSRTSNDSSSTTSPNTECFPSNESKFSANVMKN